MKRIFNLFIVYMFLVTSVFAKDMRFVQITDARFSPDADNDNLSRVVQEVNNLNDVEFVIFTGDNIQKPNSEYLKEFLNIAKNLKCPFYIVIGDKEVNKRKNFGKKQYIKTVKRNVFGYRYSNPNYIFKKHGVVFFVVDGAKEVIQNTNGFYKEDVTEWVDANLDVYKKKNIIIFQHFPIVPPCNKESYYTAKPEKYLESLSNHPNVKAVIAGHFGVNKEQEVDGVIHISTAPVPYYRVIDIIDYETNTPTIWAEVKQAK